MVVMLSASRMEILTMIQQSELANRNPGDRAEVHLTITDPALNFDPTSADVWSFDLSDNDGDVNTVTWDNNGTNSAMTAAELG